MRSSSCCVHYSYLFPYFPDIGLFLNKTWIIRFCTRGSEELRKYIFIFGKYWLAEIQLLFAKMATAGSVTDNDNLNKCQAQIGPILKLARLNKCQAQIGPILKLARHLKK
jgi:hypothetical protein